MKAHRRRRRRWYTAAGGTIAGVAGLAALTAGTNVASTEHQIPRPDPNPASGQAGHGGLDGPEGVGRHSEGTEVPCDPAALIQAILQANADGGDTLDLADHCTYSLLQHQGVNGLPIITQPIIINGHYSTIERNAAADPFRIFNVDVGGNLTLRDVTVRGGVQDLLISPGGAGLLVRAGGRATVEHSRFLDNRSLSDGGAIANYGVTEIVGGPQEHNADDRAKDGNDQASEIARNIARNSGGGVYNAGHLTVTHTRLSYNNANGGAGLYVADGVAEVSESSVDHNIAGVGAGGALVRSLTTIEDSAVEDNTTGGAGGGIQNLTSPLYLRHTIVRHNSADGAGGGISNSVGQLVVDSSRINENTTGDIQGGGGGIASFDGQVALRRTELKANQTIGLDSRGGGFFGQGSSLALTASEVAGNNAIEAPGGIETNSTQTTVNNSSITANNPTNCAGSTTTVPNCFD